MDLRSSKKSLMSTGTMVSNYTPTNRSLTFSGGQSITGMRAKFYGINDKLADFNLDTYLNNLRLDEYKGMTEEEREQFLLTIDAANLYQALEKLNKAIANLKVEGLLLHTFLEKNDPKLLIGLKERCENIQRSNSSGDHFSSQRMLRLSSRSLRSVTVHSFITHSSGSFGYRQKADYQLNFKFKLELAEKLASEITQRIREIENREMQSIKMLNARIEELQMCQLETQETANNFKVHFLQKEEDIAVLEKAPEKTLEKLLRKFINNWMKNARALLGTMRLRNTTIQEHCKQLHSDLIIKSDLSGILSAVDFEQLMIKRDQLLVTLEEKNTDMAGLKGVTGKASLAMTKEKQVMMLTEENSVNLIQKKADMERTINKLEKDIELVEVANENGITKLHHLRKHLDEYEAPSIRDYIEKKEELFNVEKEEKNMQRKVSILNMKLTNLMKRLNHKKLK